MRAMFNKLLLKTTCTPKSTRWLPHEGKGSGDQDSLDFSTLQKKQSRT